MKNFNKDQTIYWIEELEIRTGKVIGSAKNTCADVTSIYILPEDETKNIIFPERELFSGKEKAVIYLTQKIQTRISEIENEKRSLLNKLKRIKNLI